MRVDPLTSAQKGHQFADGIFTGIFCEKRGILITISQGYAHMDRR